MIKVARAPGSPAEHPRIRWIAMLTISALAAGMAVLLGAAKQIDTDYQYREIDLADSAFYQRVAERVEAGEDYYEAADLELHRGGYETRSTFNWRTPLYAHILGKFQQSSARQAALAILSLASATLVTRMVAIDLGWTWGMITGLVVGISSGWWLQPEPTWFTEVWAGQLILLSLASRSLGWLRVGLIAGTFALFLRELALPFALLCIVDAWWGRRWDDALGWSICLIIYGLYFLIHESQVAPHQVPERFYPPSDRTNWVEFGGLRFLLATTRMNYALSWLPSWCIALYLPLAIFGLLSLSTTGRNIRPILLGFSGYLVAFLIVGKEFNVYWGWITAPTLALGFAVAPAFLIRMMGQDDPETVECGRRR